MVLNSCCFCIELKTGSLIICAILVTGDFISSVSNLFLFNFFGFIFHGLGMIIHGVCIFGILKANTVMIIPSLCWLIISILIQIIMIIVINVVVREFLIDLLDNSVDPDTFSIIILIISVLYGLSAAFDLYSWLVIFSAYKQLNNPSITTNSNAYAGNTNTYPNNPYLYPTNQYSHPNSPFLYPPNPYLNPNNPVQRF